MADQTSAPKYLIRLYKPSDRSAALNIFRATADPSVQTEPVTTVGAHIWCLPYFTLSPSTCFVLDDGSGEAVGYCIGTPSTSSFADRWAEEYVPTIEQDLRALEVGDGVEGEEKAKLEKKRDELCRGIYSDPRSLVFGELEQQLKEYPGHLHIDILPPHQGRGFGGEMIRTLVTAMKAEGCNGVFLGMVASNSGAGRFYEREAFYRLPHVLDGGKSGEEGRTADGHVIYFVKDL